MNIRQYLRRLDWILIVSALLLTGIGLLSLYSSSLGYSPTGEALGKEDFFNFQKQIVFAGIGIFLMLVFSLLDYRIFKNDPYLIMFLYILSCLALAGLFFFAPEIRGVKSWYKIGPFSLDPVEFTKLVLILLLARYFSRYHVEIYRLSHIIKSGLYVFVPAALIFLQPEFGLVFVLIVLWLATLFISGIKMRPFLVLMLCGILIFTAGWSFLLKDYQKERVLSFITIEKDPLGADWSQNQAKIAIGSGGLLGQGIGQGSQTQHGFLPEPQTDFIFSAIAEEFGLVGVSALLILFLILVSRIIKIALYSESNFPRLFASGFAVILIIPIFINIGMNLGSLPVVGIPLPLISYGGSNLIMIFIGLGVLLNIRKGYIR